MQYISSTTLSGAASAPCVDRSVRVFLAAHIINAYWGFNALSIDLLAQVASEARVVFADSDVFRGDTHLVYASAVVRVLGTNVFAEALLDLGADASVAVAVVA